MSQGILSRLKIIHCKLYMQKHKNLLFFILLLLVVHTIFPILFYFLKSIEFVNNYLRIITYLSIPLFSFLAIFIAFKLYKMSFQLKWMSLNTSIVFISLVLVLSINVFQISMDLTFFKYLMLDQLRFLEPNLIFGNSLDYFIKFIVLVLLGPFTEEILFRRILLVKLLEDYKPSIAIVITSVMFALIHFDLTGIVFYLLISFVYTYIFYLTRNIWFSIILHSVFNFITFFTKIGVHNKSDSFFNIGLLIYVLLLFLIVFLIKKLIAYSKTIKEIKEFE